MAKLLAVMALLFIIPCVSAVQFTVMPTETPNATIAPERIIDNCLYFYGGQCQHIVNTNGVVPTTCTFAHHICSVNTQTRNIVLQYPIENESVPNSPSFQVNDWGVVCLGDNCVPYNITMTVFNMNWRVESQTNANMWVFVSPNGYNVIPILTFVSIVYLLWRHQKRAPHRRRYRED